MGTHGELHLKVLNIGSEEGPNQSFLSWWVATLLEVIYGVGDGGGGGGGGAWITSCHKRGPDFTMLVYPVVI